MTTIGTPPALAIQTRKLVEDTFALEVAGLAHLAGVTFGLDHQNPSFTNIRGNGFFICTFFTETKREEIDIQVTAPAAFATSWNRKSLKKLKWEQVQTCSFVIGPPMAMTITKINRELIQNSHVSFTWLVELEEDEECVLTVDGDLDRKWTLSVVRMLPDYINQEWFQFGNLARNSIPISTPDGSWTLTKLNDNSFSDVWRGELTERYRVTNTSNPSLSVHWYQTNPARSQFAHRLTVTIKRSSIQIPAAGGTGVFRLKNGGTDVHVQPFTIPTDDSTLTYTYDTPAGSLTPLDVFTDNLASGTAFEFTYKYEPIL